MTLDEARQNIGAPVLYRGGASSEDENGVITSVNDTYVFVRYADDQTGKATRPEDLTLTSGRSTCTQCRGSIVRDWRYDTPAHEGWLHVYREDWVDNVHPAVPTTKAGDVS